MIQKTKGVVLNYFKFKETSVIVKIYTEAFGIQSYIVNGVRTKKAGSKIAFFQPLTLLDLVVYYKENANINRIAELKCYYPFCSLPYDYKKSCIALFITEILVKTLKEEEKNTELFVFIQNSVIDLDTRQSGLNNFPLVFLIRLSHYLGIHFHLEENLAEDIRIIKDNARLYNDLCYLMETGFESEININKQSRNMLFDILLRYYRLHLESFGKLNSVEVFRSLA